MYPCNYRKGIKQYTNSMYQKYNNKSIYMTLSHQNNLGTE